MPATSMIHVRVEEEVKKQAAETLALMGLSVSDAVRVFLKRVIVDQAMPFDIRVPNALTRTAMAEAEAIIRDRNACHQIARPCDLDVVTLSPQPQAQPFFSGPKTDTSP